MKLRIYTFIVVLIAFFAVISNLTYANENSKLSVNLGYVEKWPEISPEDSNLPQITKT